jgi:hypothetical protein
MSLTQYRSSIRTKCVQKGTTFGFSSTTLIRGYQAYRYPRLKFPYVLNQPSSKCSNTQDYAFAEPYLDKRRHLRTYPLGGLDYAWLRRIRTALRFNGCRSAGHGTMRLVGETCSGPRRGKWCLRCEAGGVGGTLGRRVEPVEICVQLRETSRSRKPVTVLPEVDLSWFGSCTSRSLLHSRILRPCIMRTFRRRQHQYDTMSDWASSKDATIIMIFTRALHYQHICPVVPIVVSWFVRV